MKKTTMYGGGGAGTAVVLSQEVAYVTQLSHRCRKLKTNPETIRIYERRLRNFLSAINADRIVIYNSM